MYQGRAHAAQTAAVYGIPRAPAVPRELSVPRPVAEPSALPLLGSLLLLVTSYMLLLSAPLLSQKLGAWPSASSPITRLAPLLPVASGAGLTLGGAAALVFVLMRMAREAERRPYAALAPALAVFSGCIAVGLKPQLPLGVASEQVAVFALVVSVLGGSLAQASTFMTRLFGIVCTMLPTAALLLVVWIATGAEAAAPTLGALSASARAYLTILSVSSLAIGLLALIARNSVELSMPMQSITSARTLPPGLIGRDDSFSDDVAALRARALPSLRATGFALLSLCVAFAVFKVLLPRRESTQPIPVVHVQHTPVQAAQPVKLGELVVTSLATEPSLQPSSQPLEPTPEAPAAVLPEPTLSKAEEPARVAPAVVEEAPRKAAVSRSHSRRAHNHVAARATHSRTASPVQDSAREKRERVVEERQPAEAERVAEAKSSEPRVVQKERAQPAPALEVAPAKPAHGDDSLDALMDGALRGKAKPSAVGASDDPIFGL